MIRVLLTLGAAVCAVALATPAPAAGASFSDPAGDAVGGAPDLTSVSADLSGGTVTFTLVTDRATLASTHRYEVRIDADNNVATGDAGIEYVLALTGSDQQIRSWRWNGSEYEAYSVNGLAATAYVPYKLSVAHASIGGSDKIAFWTRASDTAVASARDDAPNADAYYVTFGATQPPPTQPPPTQPPPTQPPPTQPPPTQPPPTQPPPTQPPPTQPPTTTTAGKTIVDEDRDGVVGAKDICPKKAGGRFDVNRNGCPGPFPRIKPKVPKPNFTAGGLTWWAEPALFARVPAGALIDLRLGGRSERIRAGKNRTAPSKLLASRRFAQGSTFTVIITLPGWIGYQAQVEILARPPWLRSFDLRCVSPVGGKPLQCGSIGRGT